MACNSHQSQPGGGTSFLDDCDVVAAIEVVNGDSVIVCDFNKVKQKKNVPLDELLTDFTILKMDNENEEGLIGERLPDHIVGEQYIAVFWGSQMPLKLYDKQGKYIRNIGKIGQGPGEYQSVDKVYMDEKSDRIYVLTHLATRLLLYDFEGNHYPPILLQEESVMGSAFLPDREQATLIFANSPWKGVTYSVWMQDFQGNMVQGCKKSDYYEEDISFTEATITRFHTPNIEFFRVGNRNTNEYLYHYSEQENRLIPRFRMSNMVDQSIAIFIFELPKHFIVEIGTETFPGQDEYHTPKMIIDKRTLKGCHFDGFITPEGILLDQYRILARCYYGYFGLIDFGSNIAEKIEKVDKGSLSSKNSKKLEELQQLIEETDLDDDCSLLFYGKFKQ